MLACIEVRENVYYLKRSHLLLKENPDHNEKMWLVVKSLPKKTYRLIEGDIFRLGRLQFRVRELSESLRSDCKEKETHARNIRQRGVGETLDLSIYRTTKEAPVSYEGACRICLGESDEEVLIHPCYCTGSVGLIHLSCLRMWLTSKIDIKYSEYYVAYSWDTLQCELCKCEYPEKLWINEEIHDLVNIEKPDSVYIVLEAVTRDNKKTFYVINPQAKTSIKIGRGNENDIRFQDISVSRIHTSIHLRRNGAFIEDNDSKFGTLVKVAKPIAFDLGCPFSVQTGRTLLSFIPKKETKWYSCLLCGGDEREVLLNQITDESEPQRQSISNH